MTTFWLSLLTIALLVLIFVLVYTFVKDQNTLEENLQFLAQLPATKLDIPYKIYYINLDRAPDRNTSLLTHLQKYQLTNYERVPAIDGKTTDLSHYKADITSYEKACTLSHLKAIKQAYDNGEQIALIIEDDARFDLLQFWQGDWGKLIEQAPSDWEIIQLFSFNYNFKEKNYQSAKMGSSTVAYLINQAGMEKLLTKNEELDVADNYLYKLSKAYSYLPALIYPYADSSTIHNDHLTYQNKSINKVLNYYLDNKT